MKIALTNLPWKSFGKAGVRAGSRWPHLKGPTEKNYLPFPFFLAYATALLKKHNFDVALIDAIAEEMPNRYFLKHIEKISPHLLVCETSTATLEHDLRLLERINKNIPIAICGPDINIRHPAFLKNYKFIDYVLFGEYEFTLLDLVKHLNEDRGLGDVLGLIYRDSDEIKVNPSRPLCDLNELPWPLRQSLPMEHYNDTPGDLPLPSVQMLASRGCPYCCTFCLWPQVMYHENSYRARNIIDVVDEMEYLTKEMSFKSIYFDDDTFNCNKERMLRLCGEIKKRKLNVPWAIMARADLMDEEILKNMREAGLYAVKYGVESATQALLDSVRKNMDIRRTKEIIKFTKMLGIKTHLTFMFGLSGETKETIRKTIDLAIELDSTTVQFSIATPFPGTAFYKEMENKGYLSRKDLQYGVRLAYKQWAIHCIQAKKNKKEYLKGYYYQLLLVSSKKYGLFITLLWIPYFFLKRLISKLKEKYRHNKKEFQEKIKEKGISLRRLSLIFDMGKVILYWDGMKLTRSAGLLTSIVFKNSHPYQSSLDGWDFKKTNDTKFLLKAKYSIFPIQETWSIEIIDEKQVDWNVLIYIKSEIEILEMKATLALSESYKKWVDAWGEGYFPNIDDDREVELRNPRSNFIGLRGHKKLKGQLPTILFDLSKNGISFYPSIRNTTLVLGARMLEARIKELEGSVRYIPGDYTFFSGRIKIVEEDFRKRKFNRIK